jgi:hypothetical protein
MGKRYQAGYPDGSGSDYAIYDTKHEISLAVVAWGCGCCRVVRPEHAERLKLIVDAINAYRPKRKKNRSKK